MAKKFTILIGVIYLLAASPAFSRTLVTIESEKARLTLALLARLVKLEEDLKRYNRIKILLLLPKIKTAFQDQNIVNQAVRDFFAQNSDLFYVYVAQDEKEAQKLLKEKNDIKVLYVAGPVPNLKKILSLAASKKILTVSHLPELLNLGLALSLDLDRRRACIVANPKIWQKLGLKFPKEVTQKICFVN